MLGTFQISTRQYGEFNLIYRTTTLENTNSRVIKFDNQNLNSYETECAK